MKSFRLSISNLKNLTEQILFSAIKNLRELEAILCCLIAMYTQRVARSMDMTK